MDITVTIDAVVGAALVVTGPALCLTLFDLLRRLPRFFLSDHRETHSSARDVEL